MNGFEVAQILKSNNRTRDIPIIFASAEMKERDSMMKGFEEGAVDYLSKPLDPELTKAKVSVLLKLQLQKKELIEKNQALEKAEAQITLLNTYLKKNLLQLEDMNQELESFSYSVSHDLRAPLRSIIGYSKILDEDYHATLDEEGRRVVAVIRRSSGRMNSLIDSLLEFSKLGRKELTKSNIDSESLVNGVIDEIKNTIAHQAKIEVNDLLPAYADQALLTQVWVNLLSNAIKYSSKKESPVVEIGSQGNESYITYFVKDNGSGFDMAYADKLFKVFQRLHKQTEFEGTGVGLALVQKIINRHDGKVWAEGKIGEGATFYFSLPLLRQHVDIVT
jgi:two-component system sensor histidine kinase/response regulator